MIQWTTNSSVLIKLPGLKKPCAQTTFTRCRRVSSPARCNTAIYGQDTLCSIVYSLPSRWRLFASRSDADALDAHGAPVIWRKTPPRRQTARPVVSPAQWSPGSSPDLWCKSFFIYSELYIFIYIIFIFLQRCICVELRHLSERWWIFGSWASIGGATTTSPSPQNVPSGGF